LTSSLSLKFLAASFCGGQFGQVFEKKTSIVTLFMEKWKNGVGRGF
jgi:hypothetical protein